MRLLALAHRETRKFFHTRKMWRQGLLIERHEKTGHAEARDRYLASGGQVSKCPPGVAIGAVTVRGSPTYRPNPFLLKSYAKDGGFTECIDPDAPSVAEDEEPQE